MRYVRMEISSNELRSAEKLANSIRHWWGGFAANIPSEAKQLCECQACDIRLVALSNLAIMSVVGRFCCRSRRGEQDYTDVARSKRSGSVSRLTLPKGNLPSTGHNRRHKVGEQITGGRLWVCLAESAGIEIRRRLRPSNDPTTLWQKILQDGDTVVYRRTALGSFE
jgi:hypothetical protein